MIGVAQTGGLGLSIPGFVEDLLPAVQDIVTGGGSPQQIADAASERLLQQYETRVRALDPWLERQGHWAVRAAYARALPMLAPAPPAPPAPPASTPRWTERLYRPVVNPFARGAEAEALAIFKPLAWKVGGALVAYTLLVAALGRLSKRCRS